MIYAVLCCLALTADAPQQPLPATLRSVYDGDTVVVTIHLPFDVDLPDRTVRAYGYDAWELRKGRRTVKVTAAEMEKGKIARTALEKLLQNGVWVEDSGKKDPYGRVSARLWTKIDENWVDVAAWAVENGHTRR